MLPALAVGCALQKGRLAPPGAVRFEATQVEINVATRPVDFRKGIDGLALAVQEICGLGPFFGPAFAFRSKRADRIKVLVWDRTALVSGRRSDRWRARPSLHKRLEGAKFTWLFATARGLNFWVSLIRLASVLLRFRGEAVRQ